MKYLLFLITLLAFGCQKNKSTPVGESIQYFPSEVFNGTGAVWKYYVHSTPTDGQRKTNIKYRKLVFKESKLYLTDYTADFQESYAEVISMDDDQWKIDSTYRYNYRGSLDSLRTIMKYKIGEENVSLNWKGTTANLDRSISGDNWINDLKESHSEVMDTMVDGRKVKTFFGELEVNFKSETDTSNTIYNWQREYTAGRGMTNQISGNGKINYEWALDEIMTLKEFDKRSNHGMHRVAYIDPEDAIDNQNDFATCYHISQVNDYYNDDRAQHLEGKAGLWEMVESNLDVNLLKGQEGYLTYRFVVNCEGKAGRFVTEEADLEFDRIEFSTELRNHFLNMLLDIPKWKNLTIQGEARDAYVYVTFKIKDDEIIEILP